MAQVQSESGQVSDVVESAKQRTQEQAHEVVDKTRGTIRSQVEQRSTMVGEQAQSLAGSLRETAMQLRSEGDPQKARFASAADTGAEQLDRFGSYLATSSSDELIGKLEEFGRRQPYLIAGAGLLLGIAAGRFIKASSSDRYYRTTLSAHAGQTRELPRIEPVSTDMSTRRLV